MVRAVHIRVLGQDTEPNTAPDVLVGTLEGRHRHQCMNVWIAASRLWQKRLLNALKCKCKQLGQNRNMGASLSTMSGVLDLKWISRDFCHLSGGWSSQCLLCLLKAMNYTMCMEGVVGGCIIALFHSWLEGPVAQPEPIVLGQGPMTWEGRAELSWHNSDASVRPGWLGYEDLNSHTWSHAFLGSSYCKVMNFSVQRNMVKVLEAMLSTYKTQLCHNNIVTYKLVP